MEESCYHCGDELGRVKLTHDTHQFCCQACVTVYDLLKGHDLGNFYNLESAAGKRPKKSSEYQFLFLDEPEIRKKYISYEDEHQLKISLYLPDIHCSSCIYLLENAERLHKGILNVMVQFTQKEALFTLNPKAIKLSELANLLTKIGYEPNFGNRLEQKGKKNRQFLYKLGVAGFAFGNVMLWSVPEYVGLKDDNVAFRNFSAYLSLGVSIPVLLYSARDYFISAFKSLKLRRLNLDVPITLGIIALYLQSLWSIFNGEGAGYMDSFTGFIFFLLIGKWFQNWSYDSLSFERDYKSYFPVAVTKLENEQEHIVEIDKLKEDELILIRNEEIIPCDSILLSDEAQIDFSFVTGEAETVHKKKGDFIYAGGKLLGAPIQLKVEKKTQRSHLTSLWNNANYGESKKEEKTYQDRVSGYFLAVVLLISCVAGTYWFLTDKTQVTHVIVSILIVTCPCALALSSPFTLGNTSRLLGRKGLYLKNAQVVEKMNAVTDIVFDKTGTLTNNEQDMLFETLDDVELEHLSEIYSLADASLHPISLGIKRFLQKNYSVEKKDLIHFKETTGKGVEASFSDGKTFLTLRIGSAAFVGLHPDNIEEGSAYIQVDGKILAKVSFISSLREGLKDMIAGLNDKQLHILSGDRSTDKDLLRAYFPSNTQMSFQQNPVDKLNYIKHLQLRGRKVMMLGDGLNDAGALKIADVGIAVSENAFQFTPSSDAIIAADKITSLPFLLRISKRAKTVLAVCLSFSIFYNIIGLSYAFSGQMTPLIAAILMPISSVTVVLLSTFLVFFGKNNQTWKD